MSDQSVYILFLLLLLSAIFSWHNLLSDVNKGLLMFINIATLFFTPCNLSVCLYLSHYLISKLASEWLLMTGYLWHSETTLTNLVTKLIEDVTWCDLMWPVLSPASPTSPHSPETFIWGCKLSVCAARWSFVSNWNHSYEVCCVKALNIGSSTSPDPRPQMQ